MTNSAKPAVLTIRNAALTDVDAITRLGTKVYRQGGMSLTPGMLRGQIATYPEGQFVVEYEGAIVGYAAGFRIDEAVAIDEVKKFIAHSSTRSVINRTSMPFFLNSSSCGEFFAAFRLSAVT